MHIGILSVKNTQYHPNRRLREAGVSAGHRVTVIHTRNCLSEISRGMVSLKSPVGKDPLDVLFPRIGATINDFALAVVRHFEASGIRVVNGSCSILLARNKYMSLQTLSAKGIRVPDSYLVINPKGFQGAVRRLGGYPVVVKTLNSRQGTGVVLVDSQATADFLAESAMDLARGLLIQEFIPPEGRRDIRAFVIGTRVITAMELKPHLNDFRSNIHLTGEGRAVTLPKMWEGMAVQASEAMGLEIAGVDILVDQEGQAKVVEVNYSPGFKGLEAASGLDVASEIIQYGACCQRGAP